MVNYGDDVILAVTTASEPEKRYVFDIIPFCKRLLVKRSLQDLEKIQLQYVERAWTFTTLNLLSKHLE